jgi:hypothetical protein
LCYYWAYETEFPESAEWAFTTASNSTIELSHDPRPIQNGCHIFKNAQLIFINQL